MTITKRDALVHKAAKTIMQELRCYDTRSYYDLQDYLLEQVQDVDVLNAGEITNKAIDALVAMGFATRVYDGERLEQIIEINWEVYLDFTK